MLYLWLISSFALLYLVQRFFHRRLQAVLLLIFRQSRTAAITYALLLLPGIALHEASHWGAAKAVGVKVHGFSLLPTRKAGGAIRFGYVETEASDPWRGALIGMAPFVAGIALLTVLNFKLLGLPSSVDLPFSAFLRWLPLQFAGLLATPDLAIWLYLIVAISNTMMPSTADLAAVVPAAVLLTAGGLLVLGVGLGPDLMMSLGPSIGEGARFLAVVFSLTLALDVAVLIPLYLVERLISQITGLEAA